MADFTQLISLLREQMSATLSRSDVLKPLAWLIAILGLLALSMLVAGAPEWIFASIIVAMLTVTGLYVGAYIYCLRIDRDALRSEKYNLNKLALEQRLIGDSSSGLFEEKETIIDETLPTASSKQIEHQP